MSCNMLKVTQLVNKRAEIQSLYYYSKRECSLCCLLPPL